MAASEAQDENIIQFVSSNTNKKYLCILSNPLLYHFVITKNSNELVSFHVKKNAFDEKSKSSVVMSSKAVKQHTKKQQTKNKQ